MGELVGGQDRGQYRIGDAGGLASEGLDDGL